MATTMSSPFRKSSTSEIHGVLHCVEVGADTGTVMIRDTKDHGRGPVLRVDPDAFARFTAGLRS